MASTGTALGVDFGTANTAAVLRTPDARVRPVLFDGSPLLPSAVFVPPQGSAPRAPKLAPAPPAPGISRGYAGAEPPQGSLLVGRDALQRGRFMPAAFSPNPKRHIDDGRVLLGGREVAVVDLVAALLRRVAEDAVRLAGAPIPVVTMTCPTGWGPAPRRVLTDAAAAAGLGDVTLVAEPVAAAHYFTEVLGQAISADQVLVVYDFGAGTFDVSIVRPAEPGGSRSGLDVSSGLDVIAFARLTVGGLDVDAALVDRIGERYGSGQPAVWDRLRWPVGVADTLERHALWENVRVAKEMLSRTASVPLRLPVLGVDAPLTRAELEVAAGPLVVATVRATVGLMRSAGLTPDRIAGLLLVGGSSRIPLVTSVLHHALGISTTLAEQPELALAEGSLHAAPVPADGPGGADDAPAPPVRRAWAGPARRARPAR